MEYVFGPVPSRRLGRSLGVNNVPPKHCSYSCIYCQLGRVGRILSERQNMYSVEDILRAVEKRLDSVTDIDYITVVPDGEPLLDLGAEQLFSGLKAFGIPLAVITNSSLLGDQDVREALMIPDWVSIKIDAASHHMWKTINRPHKDLIHSQILAGMSIFAQKFKRLAGKTLATETMLLEGYNTDIDEIQNIAKLASSLPADVCYLSIPTRPPAEPWVKPADERAIAAAYHEFSQRNKHVEYLIGYEGNQFDATGNSADDLLSITAVHPMREEAVLQLLTKNGEQKGVLKPLIDSGSIVVCSYQGHTYYLRRFSSQP
ncbi:MAG: radical SAM protein [Spirochaetota bacterium]